MGDVVKMKQLLRVEIRRFKHAFETRYTPGDPQAAVYVDGTFSSWLNVDRYPTGVVLELGSDDVSLVTPEMLGMSIVTKDAIDHKFILETEDYLLSLMGKELSRLLGEEGATDDGKTVNPADRALRVMDLWHTGDKSEEHLLELITIELYDAAESLGTILEGVLDEETGYLVQKLVGQLLQSWHEEES